MLQASNVRIASLLPMLVLTCMLGLAMVSTGCGDDDGGSGCPAEGAAVDGVAGAVYSPSCSAPVSEATVSLMNGDGVMISVATNADGQFVVPSSMLGSNGIWRVSVSKGPFSGDTRDIEVGGDGMSTFVVLTLNTGS